MAITRSSHPGRAAVCACVLVVAASVGQLGRAEDMASPDNAYLDELQGDWDMVGTVRGRPVRYRARGERVLQGGFLRLHMIDAEAPPKYEADVFIGFDAKAGDYVAHWLDRFGAGGVCVVATGKRDGPRLIIRFPYAAGLSATPSRSIRKRGAWTLLLEAEGHEGAWSTFASYRPVHPVADHNTSPAGR